MSPGPKTYIYSDIFSVDDYAVIWPHRERAAVYGSNTKEEEKTSDWDVIIKRPLLLRTRMMNSLLKQSVSVIIL